jgi:hypothetical protein
MVEQLQASQAASDVRHEELRREQEALRLAQEANHQQQLAAVALHYQCQLANLIGYFWSQILGTQEPPPSLFAPPPVPLPVPAPGPVSIFPVALAYAAILQVLITSLGLCAGTVGGFEPDSRCQPSTGSFSTAWLATLPELPHAAVRLASSTVVGALRACKLPVAAAGALLAAAVASELVVVGARWGLWDPWGQRLKLGTFTSRFWTLLWHVGHVLPMLDVYQ